MPPFKVAPTFCYSTTFSQALRRLKPPAITSTGTRNRGNPGTGYDMPEPTTTPFKGQVFLSSQNPELMSFNVVVHQSTST